MKKIVAVIAVIVLVFGWLTIVLGFGGSLIKYEQNISLAKQSVEKGLYEQGVEFYNNALSIKNNKNLYKDIKNTYYAFYEQQDNAYSYNRYIKSLDKCCEVFPEDKELWEELINQYYEKEKYSDANAAIKKAENRNVTTEKIQSIKKQICNIYDVYYLNILSYKTGKNGTYSVFDGNSSWIMRYNGDAVGIEYDYVGPQDESGMSIFNDKAGSNIRDVHQITRCMLPVKISESGYFNSGFAPVKVEDKWIYISETGDEAEIGSFDYACSMYDGVGAVKNDEKWKLINASGDSVIDQEFDDIVLNQYGCHTDGEYFIASANGTYGIFDLNGNKLVDLSAAAEINVGEFSDWFAYKDKTSGLWGYMNKSGEVVLEPAYNNAKGFSNGYAAVCNKDGLWGVIDADGSKITENEFYFIGYFTPEKSCIVARTEGSMGIFTFLYN